MKLKLLQDRRAYSLTFWTVFFGFILIPIMALGIELGRYYYARAEIAKAADAAKFYLDRVKNPNFTKNAPEVGFLLHPDCWGKGLGREAMTAVIDHLFATHPLPHLTAEADPRNDLEGWDAAVKACTLANALMGADLRPAGVGRQGITGISAEEVSGARHAGKRLRLIVRAWRDGRHVRVKVAPEAVPADDLLVSRDADGVLVLETDLMGEVGLWEGRGGVDQTAYALFASVDYALTEDWDLKASQTLEKGWGMCSGKTNLLVAMLRSVGIPARYRVYQLKANMAVWQKAGREMGRQGIAEELGEVRDHVDCQAWLGKWVDFDPGRDTAMERGMLSLGMPLERNKVADARGRVIYHYLAVFDNWARQRQARRKFRSERMDVFAEINRGFDKLRDAGKATSH